MVYVGDSKKNNISTGEGRVSEVQNRQKDFIHQFGTMRSTSLYLERSFCILERKLVMAGVEEKERYLLERCCRAMDMGS